jgi:hypothetical protein
VDRRSRVRVRHDVVRGVARRANGRDGQTLTKQTFAVDAQRVVLEYVVLRDLVGQ